MEQTFVRTDAASVCTEHGRMFRRLARQIGVHKSALTEDGMRVLTRAAFALYLDSRNVQLPLFDADAPAYPVTSVAPASAAAVPDLTYAHEPQEQAAA